MDKNYVRMEEEREIDLRDLLAWIFLRWKVVLCAILAGTVLMGLYGFVKLKKSTEEVGITSPEHIESLRESLTETEAVDVENAVRQYQIYQNSITSNNRFSSIVQDVENNGLKMMMVKYYVTSRMRYSASFYTEMALSDKDYEEILRIAYNNGGQEDAISRGILPVQLWDDRYDYEDTNIHVSNKDHNLPYTEEVLITSIIACKTEEQCERIKKIVDAAFEKETQKLKEMDKDILCTCVDAHYSTEKYYYDEIEKKIVEKLTLAQNGLVALKVNIIDKFTEDQKNYFEALKASDQDTKADMKTGGDSVNKSESFWIKGIIKYALIGGLLGLFLAAGVYSLIYVFDGSIKTDHELYNCRILTLDTIYIDKGENLIRRMYRKIRGIRMSSTEAKEQMLAKDISIMMEGCAGRRLYMILTSDNAQDAEFAEKIKGFIDKAAVDTEIGNPLRTPDALKALSESDLVVMLVHVKETKRDTLRRLLEVCGRYSKDIAGAIVIEEC